MKIYVDEENRIKDVGTTTDETLREIEIDDEETPFKGWSTAKICCYKIAVEDGRVIMLTPYHLSSELDYIDEIGMACDILLGNMEVPNESD
jgi:hypothetical protein